MGGLLDSGERGKPARLRDLLERSRPLVLPGAYDALSARLVEAAGFDGVYMTGFGVAASTLGRPDVGLLGGAEMADQAARVVATVTVPVVADADTGYGNAINVIRTIHDYERAGVAGLHLEDQLIPKRCGHLDGKQVVPLEEMVAKIRAAVDARRDPDLVLIARTDARAVEGLAQAIERARAYADAGADVLFVEAVRNEAEAEQVAEELSGHRLLYNWAEGGRSPLLSYDRLAELGYAMVLAPISTLLSAAGAIRRTLDELSRAASPAAYIDKLPSQESFLEAVGYGEIQELENRYR